MTGRTNLSRGSAATEKVEKGFSHTANKLQSPQDSISQEFHPRLHQHPPTQNKRTKSRLKVTVTGNSNTAGMADAFCSRNVTSTGYVYQGATSELLADRVQYNKSTQHPTHVISEWRH